MKFVDDPLSKLIFDAEGCGVMQSKRDCWVFLFFLFGPLKTGPSASNEVL